MKEKTALAFTAGFFCGDGCANITTLSKRRQYKPRITFTQKDPQILEWIMEQFPQYHWAERAYQWPRAARITLNRNSEIANFAQKLLPYVFGSRKRAELEILIAWPKEAIPGKALSKKTRALRKQLFQKMKVLKRKDRPCS